MSLMLDIMQGIETRLKTIEGLRTHDTVPGAISPPAAVVGIPTVTDYHGQLGRARLDIEAQVTVFTSQGWTRTGQEQLAAYADPTGDKSILAAIEGDRRLGGVVGDCTVQNFRPLDSEEFGEIGYFGGLFTLLILPLPPTHLSADVVGAASHTSDWSRDGHCSNRASHVIGPEPDAECCLRRRRQSAARIDHPRRQRQRFTGHRDPGDSPDRGRRSRSR